MISLAITNFNRCDMVLEALRIGLESTKISEIIINDDYSDIKIYNDILYRISLLDNPKIKIYRNNKNLKAFSNKIEAIKKCNNDWIILLDSDNFLTQKYLDSIPFKLDANCFYLPSIAICEADFDYTDYIDISIDKNIFKEGLMAKNKLLTCFNTGNFLINKNTYLSAVNDPSIVEPHGFCSLYPIFLSFKNIDGFRVSIVEGMEYFHRLHSSHDKEMPSWYSATATLSNNFLDMLIKNINTL